MEKCPDTEILEQFVVYELTENMNEQIVTHLTSCDRCREKVGCLLSEEHGLIKTLLFEQVSRKQATDIPSGRCLSIAAILAYAGKCLKEDQLMQVESHLRECDNCMIKLLNVQNSMNMPAVLDLDMSILKAVPDFGNRVLEIVLKTKDDLVEIIRHTGELLSLSPQFANVRGKEEREEKTLVIRKDFLKKDLSIEVTIKKVLEESGVAFSVSVMKLSNEEFLSGIDIEIPGGEMHVRNRTNKNGFAEFSGIKAGTYDIKLGGEVTVIIDIE